MITTRALTKRFGPTVAVNEVDLVVREGDRYGFLGPNGSGKTTLVRMLLGLVYPTSGEIELMGRPVPKRVRDVLPEIGAMVEGPAAVPYLSGRMNLSIIDAAGPRVGRRRARIEEALERVGLAGIDRRPVRTYSLGMRQRLGLAAALLRHPRLLVLDEPTNGLDPRGIKEVRDLLLDLNRNGTTVFMSSHLLSEVDSLCDRVGVVDRGRLVLQEDLAVVREPTGRVLVDTLDPADAVRLLDGQVEFREGNRLVVRSGDPAALNSHLVAGGVRVREIAPQRRTLEQVVFEVTGEGSDRVPASTRHTPNAPAVIAEHAPPGRDREAAPPANPTDRSGAWRGAGAGTSAGTSEDRGASDGAGADSAGAGDDAGGSEGPGAGEGGGVG
ncbi:MAG TPA: ABC transporter ATP-binding protein [Pseudonocardiaceae bacterium]|nr:ABC transporter ATP-binding protein [Pseudonocardiaceae bacterium]